MNTSGNKEKRAIIALGGNAITRKEIEDTIANQFSNTRSCLTSIVELARRGYGLCISHGNGPQVGNALLRVELARGKAPILPLGICVADTEGGMGYMIEQSLQNRLDKDGVNRQVCTIISQIVVDKDDPSIANPTKYVGQFYSEEEALRLAKESGWKVKQDADRGWRRVVASPVPKSCVEKDVIKLLLDNDVIVLAAGGGGIPVYIHPELGYEGVDAVIDKDRASAMLGRQIGAELMLILTSVEQVALNFGQPNEKLLEDTTVSEMKKFLEQGHFPPGSMGPKVEAAIDFIENGGEKVIVTSLEMAAEALQGKAGTRIYPD
ncbi:MAG: carbamate kinase [candidate division Zixibacteria bacterium]|nr:carbamate kinase [candidate division Zixibacteria bacterium]